MSQDLTDEEHELIEASEKGESFKVLHLLNDSINPNIRDWYGMTPLHYATQNGHLKTVKALVLNGAKVNVRDYDDRIALHLSVHFSFLDISEYLIQHQANVNAKDMYGLTPLFYASAYGDFIMTDMILFYAEGEQVRDPEGKTPFLAAVWGGHLENASLLLKYFAEISERDHKENNAIHLAALNSDFEMIDSLISWGCDKNAVNINGYSCLDLAIQENNPELIEKLISSGVDVNNKIRKGLNSLDLVLMTVTNPEIRIIMEDAGALRNKRISFSQPAITSKINTSFQDAFSTLQMELWEPKYGVGFNLGVSQRLGRLKVLSPIEENIRYQYRETRTGFLAGMQKQWMILRIDRQNRIGMNLGLDAALFIGHNKGSEIMPEKIWAAIPSTGLYWHSGPWVLSLSALHQNMNTYQLSSMRMGLSVTYRFNEIK